MKVHCCGAKIKTLSRLKARGCPSLYIPICGCWYQSPLSLRVPSLGTVAASAGLPLNLKPLVPYLGAVILLHQFLGSLEERSIGGTDRHRCGLPQQFTIQRA